MTSKKFKNRKIQNQSHNQHLKAPKEHEEVIEIPCGPVARRKSVGFDPAKNNTRIFHRKDTPESIKREFKKTQEPCPMKSILRKPSFEYGGEIAVIYKVAF
jgi:hypothetical protein